MLKGLAIISLLLMAAAVPACALEVTRMTEDAGDGTCTVRISLDTASVVGITETVPQGSTVTSCSLPEGQWNYSGDRLYLALLGEKEVTYTLTGDLPETLSGTWIDLSDGKKGVVSAPGGESGTGNSVSPSGETTHPETAAPAPTKAGAGMAVVGLSLASLAFAAYAGRRCER